MAKSSKDYQTAIPTNHIDPGTPWLSPKSLIPLQPTETQLWRIALDPAHPVATTFLSPNELDRANRFRHAESRAHFITARTALRLILAQNLHTEPQSLTFTTNHYGKPALDQPSSIAFNLAHSGGAILIALAHNASLGVDLELITPNPDILEIAARMFTSEEAATLTPLPASFSQIPTPSHLAFFRLWSRKEAVLKAEGRGLSLPATSFSALSPVVPVDGNTFYLHDIPLAPTHAAALATTHPHANLHLHWFPSRFLPGT
jgi:4'-phosphopantetheinyl transferase